MDVWWYIVYLQQYFASFTKEIISKESVTELISIMGINESFFIQL